MADDDKLVRLVGTLAILVSLGIACSGPTDSLEPAVFGPLGDRPGIQVHDRLPFPRLDAPTDVVRDTYGRPHIYATTLADAMRAEGYMIARDRAGQLELLRRTAEGRMAQIFGDISPNTIDSDIAFRQIGLARIARAQNALIGPGEVRAALEGYAEGVTNAFRDIREGRAMLPESWSMLPIEAFTDWSAVDSLAVARLQTFLLSYDADVDIGNQVVLDNLKATFHASAKDQALRARTGIERDLWWFAPLDPIAERPALSPRPQPSAIASSPSLKGKRTAPKAASIVANRTVGFRDVLDSIRNQWAPAGFGSNAWAISGIASATNHALLASDPHLALTSPGGLWPVSITVGMGSDAAMRLSGAAMPGIPGVILGHNGMVAWGATVTGYDVSDAYSETVSADGQGVVFGTSKVPFQSIDEVIEVRGSAPLVYHVKIVPHHGPIVPVIEGHRVIEPSPGPALSVRWTGSAPTLELAALFGLAHARTTDEGVNALASYAAGAQNWVLADTSGNIAWTSSSHIPIRKREAFSWNPSSYTGTLPCLVLPGDGSAEWTGMLPAEYVPAAKNPASSHIISANNDPTGDLADNDPSNASLPNGTPMYWGCGFDVGYRASRIRARITSANRPLGPEDLSAIQADVRSALGANLVPVLLTVLNRAQEEYAHPDSNSSLSHVLKEPAYDPVRIAEVRTLLETWGADADYRASAGIDLATGEPSPTAGVIPEAIAGRASQATLIFNLWLRNVIIRTLRDEAVAASVNLGHDALLKAIVHLLLDDPRGLATYDPVRRDSIVWDDIQTTDVVETRDDRIVQALLDSIIWLDQKAGSDERQRRWGAYHTVTMSSIAAPIGTSIPARNDRLFSSGFPRDGDEFCVDAAEYNLATVEPDPYFMYRSGPAQRFVIDLDPAGPRAWNAFPTGNSMDPSNHHFRDETEYWRTNRAHLVPFTIDEMIHVSESRIVLIPTPRSM
ncbi:penicillin acylase family protein [Pendulispora brunnea]|uniref:Penicillin acylase family protein n=1 Tax=Pendulispora brunnea TaxID=2905690 RepID=A0ABZ2KJD6_9BACT